MNITIDFRHTWSDIDHVAHIQREDPVGRQARKVLAAAKAQLSRDIYSSVFANYSHWCKKYSGSLDTWHKTCEERRNLEEVCRRYEPRTYTVKELDELTRDEWNCVDPWDIELLSDFERKKYGV